MKCFEVKYSLGNVDYTHILKRDIFTTSFSPHCPSFCWILQLSLFIIKTLLDKVAIKINDDSIYVDLSARLWSGTPLWTARWLLQKLISKLQEIALKSNPISVLAVVYLFIGYHLKAHCKRGFGISQIWQILTLIGWSDLKAIISKIEIKQNWIFYLYIGGTDARLVKI